MFSLTKSAGATLAALTLVVGAACTSTTTSSPPTADTGSNGTSAPVVTPTLATQVKKTTGELTTQDLVKLAEPSVVRIATNGGVGTGFIVDEAGFIVTNNHVVQTSSGRNAATVQVTTSDGATYTGRVVGADPRSDQALVKIEATGLKALKIGNLDDVQVGQDVVAIGYALDLKGGEGPSYSVTRGIISAKNRAISESAFGLLGSIQTDAAINHGNSGGPLLNLFGEVVGMNTAIAPDPTTGAVAPGIGFAVGADTMKAVYEQLKANGKVSRGLLGIQNFEALRPAKAKQLGIPDGSTGVVIGPEGVASGGPADKAGIRGGDVISKIGEFAIRNEADLAVAMIRTAPGQKVGVEYYRDGKKQTTDVTLATPAQ
ncbi:MAG: trypsin-like peptidase domain-containing protein [Tepidiformaceae bacterium]